MMLKRWRGFHPPAFYSLLTSSVLLVPVAVALGHLLNLLAFLLRPLLSPPYSAIIPYIEYGVKYFLLILTPKRNLLTKILSKLVSFLLFSYKQLLYYSTQM